MVGLWTVRPTGTHIYVLNAGRDLRNGRILGRGRLTPSHSVLNAGRDLRNGRSASVGSYDKGDQCSTLVAI